MNTYWICPRCDERNHESLPTCNTCRTPMPEHPLVSSEPVKVAPERPGYDALWLWFGLSHASWLTLPRVLMHEMPDDWQKRMADLLNEYESFYPNLPTDIIIRVIVKTDDKFINPHHWLHDYHHPDMGLIEAAKQKPVDGSANP